jgi:phosphoribosyl 1,2-cyclic phosphate phosphodiesterase
MIRTVTILGCGSSGGVPRLGNKWGACDPSNKKNQRRRCSVLIEQTTSKGTTRVLIDTSPDLRSQLLSANIGELDAVIYTHAHADHVHGLDDLRMIVINMRRRLPVYADKATKKALLYRFNYAFETPKGSSYPPILDMNEIKAAFEITGDGGSIDFIPFEVNHGDMDALGFRVGDMAYLPDVFDIPSSAWQQLNDLKLWIVDALRYTPHPSHAHVEKTLGWISKVKPQHTIITNMHIDLDYATFSSELPDSIEPAFDMMKVTI